MEIVLFLNEMIPNAVILNVEETRIVFRLITMVGDLRSLTVTRALEVMCVSGGMVGAV